MTSIPVISRIFHDLRILHTLFASIVLGTALLEDIALWAVLAVATAMATTTEMGRELANSVTEPCVPRLQGRMTGFPVAWT